MARARRKLWQPYRFDPRNLGWYGLTPGQRKCKCCEESCSPICEDCGCCTPNQIIVTIAGLDNDCCIDSSLEYNITQESLLNGTFVLNRASDCCWSATVLTGDNFYTVETCEDTTGNITCSGGSETRFNLTLCRVGSEWQFEIVMPCSNENGGSSNNPLYFATSGGSCGTVQWRNFIFPASDGCLINTTVTHTPYACANCAIAPFFNNYGKFRHSASFTFEAVPCCEESECSLCAGCIESNEVTCATGTGCCTPDTIRAVTSSVTITCLDTCVTRTGGTIQSYKLTGTTAINRTIDLAHLSSGSCTWRGSVASDHVLKRATKHTLNTLVYEAERTATDTWTNRVYARNAGDTIRVYFFDGTVNTGTGLTRCSVLATATNGQTSCDLAAATKRGGHSGTFDKPVTTGTGTACTNCAASDTPASFSATVAGVGVCTEQCDGNRWKLTGTTAVNRTITINQVGGSPCLLRGTVAADYILYDHDTAAATFTIDTIRYELNRTGATTGTWEIAGYSGATKRISYAGGDFGSCFMGGISISPTANDCANWPTATHPSRTCCVANTTDTGIFGSGGSTSFTACPV